MSTEVVSHRQKMNKVFKGLSVQNPVRKHLLQIKEKAMGKKNSTNLGYYWINYQNIFNPKSTQRISTLLKCIIYIPYVSIHPVNWDLVLSDFHTLHEFLFKKSDGKHLSAFNSLLKFLLLIPKSLLLATSHCASPLSESIILVDKHKSLPFLYCYYTIPGVRQQGGKHFFCLTFLFLFWKNYSKGIHCCISKKVAFYRKCQNCSFFCLPCISIILLLARHSSKPNVLKKNMFAYLGFPSASLSWQHACS